MSHYLLSTAQQGSEQWLLDRLGRVTGSRASDALSGEKTAGYRNYLAQLAVERIGGKSLEDTYVSRDMEWGIATEPFARMAYEGLTGELVPEAGFAYLPTIMAGCSVDGFVGDDGILEIKCPKTATHIAYLLGGVFPTEYAPQVMHNLWVTGKRFADFVSFDPRVPQPLQLFVLRVTTHELTSFIRDYEGRVMRFLFDVADMELRLRERMKQ